VRGLLFLLVGGCTVADPFAGSGAEESEVAQRSVIEPCPTAQWCIESPPAGVPSNTMLHAVFALDENDVFAVGNDGTILRRVNGNDWFAMASGTTSNLRSVWGSSASDVWAGGVSGTLLHYDGTSWSPISAPISNVDSIWGSSSTNVWFVGSTTVLRWNGSTFNVFGFGGTLLSVSGTSPTDVWVTGENTYLHRYNGVTWSTVMPMGTGSTYLAVFARSFTDVWAATVVPTKETTRWNGIKWTPFKNDVRMFFNSIAGESANNVWAAGNSRIGHWTGASWTSEEPFGDQTLWSITTAPGHVWVVGDDAFIAHRASY
jgi:hypothetical protein